MLEGGPEPVEIVSTEDDIETTAEPFVFPVDPDAHGLSDPTPLGEQCRPLTDAPVQNRLIVLPNQQLEAVSEPFVVEEQHGLRSQKNRRPLPVGSGKGAAIEYGALEVPPGWIEGLRTEQADRVDRRRTAAEGPKNRRGTNKDAHPPASHARVSEDHTVRRASSHSQQVLVSAGRARCKPIRNRGSAALKAPSAPPVFCRRGSRCYSAEVAQ